MKIAILITARLGSERLKRKHMLAVCGKPIISYLLGRVSREFEEELSIGEGGIIIATSDEEENRGFEIFSGKSLKVFYGSIDNIPLRHLQAAEAHSLDAIVSIDGDDILCATSAMRAVYSALKDGKSYVATEGMPFGMNVFGYTKDVLSRALSQRKESKLETGWGCIFEGCRKDTIRMSLEAADDRMRYTLDYPDDYRFFNEVITSIGANIYEATDQEIVEIVRRSKMYKINEGLNDIYWQNYNANRAKEESESRL